MVDNEPEPKELNLVFRSINHPKAAHLSPGSETELDVFVKFIEQIVRF